MIRPDNRAKPTNRSTEILRQAHSKQAARRAVVEISEIAHMSPPNARPNEQEFASVSDAVAAFGLDVNRAAITKRCMEGLVRDTLSVMDVSSAMRKAGIPPVVVQETMRRAKSIRYRRKRQGRDDEIVAKAKAFPEGTVRTHGGRQVVKRGGKWVPHAGTDANKELGSAGKKGAGAKTDAPASKPSKKKTKAKPKAKAKKPAAKKPKAAKDAKGKKGEAPKSKHKQADVAERFDALKARALEAGIQIRGKLNDKHTHDHLDKLEARLNAHLAKQGEKAKAGADGAEPPKAGGDAPEAGKDAQGAPEGPGHPTDDSGRASGHDVPTEPHELHRLQQQVHDLTDRLAKVEKRLTKPHQKAQYKELLDYARGSQKSPSPQAVSWLEQQIKSFIALVTGVAVGVAAGPVAGAAAGAATKNILGKSEDVVWFSGGKLVVGDLEKAERPSGSGWHAIPGGRHGGLRRRGAKGYDYWYPSAKAARGAAGHHNREAQEALKRKVSWEDYDRRHRTAESVRVTAEERAAVSHHTIQAEEAEDFAAKVDATGKVPLGPRVAPVYSPAPTPAVPIKGSAIWAAAAAHIDAMPSKLRETVTTDMSSLSGYEAQALVNAVLKRAGYNDAGSGSSYRRATGRTWVDPTGDHRYVVQENGQSVRRESHYKRDGKMGWYGSGQGAAIDVLTKWSKLGGTHVGDKTAEKKAKKREGALGYEDSVHAAVETMHTHLKSGLDKLLPADVVASRRESGKKFGGASFSRSGELLVKVAQASGYKESTVGKTTWYESPDGSHRFTAKRWADDTLVSVKKPNGKWGKKTKVNTWGHADPFVTIMNNHLFAPAAEPPKPKPEVKPPKPKKSLTTGTRPKGRGAAQNAVIAHMAAMGPHARFTLTDMARAPAFRRMDFGKIQSAVGALAKRGVVYEDATGGLSWGEAWFAKPKAGGAVAPKPPKPPKPPPPPKPKTRHSTVGKSRDMNEHGHRYELKPGDTLKARAKHGGGEVKVLADGKYEYDGKTYKSTNALLNVLHKIGTEGAPKRHGTTFGRYFGLVKQQRPGKVAKALGELRTLLKSHGVLVTIEDDGNEIGLMGDLAKAGVPAHMLPHAGAGYTSMDDEVAEDLISHLRGSA